MPTAQQKWMSAPMTQRNDDICDVPGVLVGHDTDLAAGTGCTVIRCTTPARGSVDVRGGAPATRETDLLDPTCTVNEIHAILLAGGSAFGLDAATGVMAVLEREGTGFDTGFGRVPIVPAAALFDLNLGAPHIRPDAAAGMRATDTCVSGPVAQGTVGAGTGATIGKMGGPRFMVKGGLGSASAQLPSGHVVGALVAVNALGDVYEESTGRLIAGARNPSGTGWLAASSDRRREADIALEFPGGNTTLAVIATTLPCSKSALAKIAQMAHDGLARAIRPVHTPMDGDTIFGLSLPERGDFSGPDATPVEAGMAGALAATTLARAVVRAIRAATSLHGIPALRDLPGAQESVEV